MKKFLTLVFLGIMIFLGVTVFSACEQPHEHIFYKQVATEEYLKSAATCTDRAQYYYSCECGEKGEESFEYGMTLPHTYDRQVATDKYLKTDATCTDRAQYYYSCECGERGTETFEYGETFPHTYDRQVATDKHLKTDATCTDRAQYYYSCQCGEKGTETFEYGEAKGHAYADVWTYDENNHWHAATCEHSELKKDEQSHDFNYDTHECKICGYVTERLLGTEFSAPSFSVIGDTISNKVYNAQNIMSFNDELTLAEGATIAVYADERLEQPLTGKTVGLKEGPNEFYLKIVNGEKQRVIKADVYRNRIVTVTFNANGGTQVSPQRVEEGFPATEPAAITRVGYTFDKWDYDFNIPVSGDLTINARWNIITYTITYENTHGAENANATTYTVEEKVTFSPLYYNEYYDCKLTCDGREIKSTEGLARDITVTATWSNKILEISGTSIVGLSEYAKTLPTLNITEEMTALDNITNIGDYAFRDCISLTSITIPDSVTSIGNWAFSYCSSLTSVTIPNSVTSIGYDAFYDCSSLTSVTIPNSVTSIGDCAFYGCSSLTSITIPDSVTSIKIGAFYRCGSLTSIAIPNSVTSIGNYAFYGCSGLTSITIGNGVTSIGEYAFENCSKISEVYYAGTEEQWSLVSIKTNGNVYLTSATRYYYSETEPALNSSGDDYDGNYWHYASDGKTPVVWKKQN